MREISVMAIKEAIKEMCISANKELPCDLEKVIRNAKDLESDELPRSIMSDIARNLDAAHDMNIPICQDTGMVVVFAEVGQDLHIVDGNFEDAINEGVRQAYTEGLLRKSIVSDPLTRINTNDNTPAVIHTRIVAGDKIKLIVSPKGFGSENMSKIKMFTPSAGKDDIIDFVLDVVKEAGGNPCPPIVLGIGIGGDFELSAILAKKALCRPISERNQDEDYAKLEEEILKKVNETGIGPQGFGGNVTALAVNIEKGSTHIAGLPVAVNVGCHVTRHSVKIL